jgi:hypothetical protein
MNDSASICVFEYFYASVEDKEIKPVIGYALELSKVHVQKITEIFKEENCQIPYGFTLEEDVQINAPRLYSDIYYLNFIHQMAKVGLSGHGLNLSHTVRDDCTKFFTQCLEETVKLYEMSKGVLLSKGLYVRSPYIQAPEHVDFVKEQSFLKGFLGDKRPLLTTEIASLYANFQRNAIGMATIVGFSQVAKSKDVIQFFIRGKEISAKHCVLFGEKLKEDDLPVPMTWDGEVTDCTQPVFSEKLMMFMISILTSLSIQYYGLGIAVSPRRDIGVMYNRISTEVQLYGEDGANIMIKHGWLEEEPKSADRDKLAIEKEE